MRLLAWFILQRAVQMADPGDEAKQAHFMAWVVLIICIPLFVLGLMGIFLSPDTLMRLHILRRDAEDWGRCLPIMGGLATLLFALLFGAGAIVVLTH